jgi:hypothetical protein
MLNINANIVGRLMKYGIPTPPGPVGNFFSLKVEVDDETVYTKNMSAHTIASLVKEESVAELNPQSVLHDLGGVVATESMDESVVDLNPQTVSHELSGVIADEDMAMYSEGEVTWAWDRDLEDFAQSTFSSNPFTMGWRFTVAADMTVKKLRHFARVSRDIKMHVWNSGGSQLGSVTFACTANEWSEGTLETPIDLTNGNTYTVSYNYVGNDGIHYSSNAVGTIDGSIDNLTMGRYYKAGHDEFPDTAYTQYFAVDFGFTA